MYFRLISICSEAVKPNMLLTSNTKLHAYSSVLGLATVFCKRNTEFTASFSILGKPLIIFLPHRPLPPLTGTKHTHRAVVHFCLLVSQDLSLDTVGKQATTLLYSLNNNRKYPKARISGPICLTNL